MNFYLLYDRDKNSYVTHQRYPRIYATLSFAKHAALGIVGYRYYSRLENRDAIYQRFEIRHFHADEYEVISW